MTVDEALTTTRSVRRRLDLTRPVPRAVVHECLHLAFQAPNGSNRQMWNWVLVDDPETRRAMAEIYRAAIPEYVATSSAPQLDPDTPEYQRMLRSTGYLVKHLHEVPVLVVPTIDGRVDHLLPAHQAHLWGSILPATWSFMLALRARGLGSAWTVSHLAHEREMAELLGIPFADVTQAGLFPVAYTIGTAFKPGDRAISEDTIRWNHW
jgi:nitroreductase